MREIPSLQILCLRSIGSHACSAEDTFAPTQSKKPSTASRLLRSFHRRPVGEKTQDNASSLKDLPMSRTPCIGTGSSRRVNVNNVDLHHPVVGTRLLPTTTTMNKDDANQQTSAETILISQYNNPALDVLQSYIDSLVELGRMDDTRLGQHFFEEFRANIVLGGGGSLNSSSSTTATTTAETGKSTARPAKKRRRGRSASSTPVPPPPPPVVPTTPPEQMGSLSLYNCAISVDTLEALQASGLGKHLSVLDLTGVHGLTDEVCDTLLKECCHLERLSLKNGRRLTCHALKSLNPPTLVSLDVGGCFNIPALDLVQTVIPRLSKLTELHASGLGWTDPVLGELMRLQTPWTALSLGFSGATAISLGITAPLLRQQLLIKASTTLTALALPFCETLVDNALMGMMGRNLPALMFLDVRGNPALQTVTGWYDGRASADLPAQALTVLARYSSISAATVEETKRIHPLETVSLVVVLDGGGTGLAIPAR